MAISLNSGTPTPTAGPSPTCPKQNSLWGLRSETAHIGPIEGPTATGKRDQYKWVCLNCKQITRQIVNNSL